MVGSTPNAATKAKLAEVALGDQPGKCRAHLPRESRRWTKSRRRGAAALRGGLPARGRPFRDVVGSVGKGVRAAATDVRSGVLREEAKRVLKSSPLSHTSRLAGQELRR